MADLFKLMKAAGLNIKADHYSKPTLPYGVYIDDVSTSGPDFKPGMCSILPGIIPGNLEYCSDGMAIYPGSGCYCVERYSDNLECMPAIL